MKALVVGVDPGVTTGIAALLLLDDGHDGVDCRALQVNGHDLVVPVVEAVFDHWPAALPLLAVERFVVSTRSGRSMTATAGQVTRDLIGELQALAQDDVAGTALRIVTRSAAEVKPWATDRRLQAAGLLEATDGMRHARDAARHALFAAVHTGLLGDPLGSKAAAR